MRGRRVLFALAAVLVLFIGALFFLNAPAGVASGYVAKTLCSEVFLAGRREEDVRAGDFAGISPVIELVGAKLDLPAREVRAAIFGLGRARAVYRDGLGCTLVHGEMAAFSAPPAGAASAPWPEGFAGSPGAVARIDYASLDRALDAAIADERAATRALLVVVDGRVVGERYAEGFDASTRFLSWSMAKSVTATLVGAAVLKGFIDLDAAAAAPEWTAGEARAAITWNDLLRMQTGLAFDESYENPLSDVNRMLFSAPEAAAVAARRELVHPPGAHWSYSSGTSNLVARRLKGALEAGGADYPSFPRAALFDPLGAASAVFEVDSAGNFVGSSFVYATARDWARLGQLYLQDGVWNGARLLPEGWSAYVSSPTPASNGEYGAHFWLNRDGAGRTRFLPGVPESVYYMAGHEGQYVFIVPDRNAVIVRTGATRGAVPIEVVAPVVKDLVDAIGVRT